jgi:hypothetical protein
MLLSQREVDILLVAGFYKAVPANLSPDLGGDTLKWLLEMNLLKLNRSKTTCRLSNQGRELLATAGFTFKPDKHPLGDGELLTRRLQSAEIALALQQIGVDVFLQDLPREPIPQTYLSAYALRINSCSNILGMAKFNGYLYTPNIVYIIYHLGSKLSGFYPSTESETFVRHARSTNRDWRVLFIGGKDYKEAFDLYSRKKESTIKKDCNFAQAAKEFERVEILPLNLIGLRILRIMSVPDYKEKLVTYLLDAKRANVTSISDGMVAENHGLQINLSNDVNRLQCALKYFDTISLLHICEQSIFPTVYFDKKIKRCSMNLDEVENVIGLGSLPDLTRVPFIDRNGNGIHLGERKIYA